MKLMDFIKKFWNDEEGVTMIEYVLIASLVAVVSIVAWQNLGTAINNQVTNIGNTISNPTPG